MEVNDNEKTLKSPIKNVCELCDFMSSSNKDYNRHLLTRKHLKTTITTLNDNEKNPKEVCKNFACGNCPKKFKDRAGLWRHNKKCNVVASKPVHENKMDTDKDLILVLIKENSELKHMMMEQHASTQNMMLEVIKNGTHHTTNHTNSHNKTFNLQVFLNETCKDAMNITDFVNNIQLQLSDLEKMGEVGYVNGLSNIIVKNLKDMDVSSRPIHCTDSKREIMYIKDEDKWDKELNGNPKVRNAIKHIAHKNSKLLNEFKEKNPDYNNSSSRVSDKYNKLLIETMGGKGDNDVEKENKIIRNITKEVIVEKENTLS